MSGGAHADGHEARAAGRRVCRHRRPTSGLFSHPPPLICNRAYSARNTYPRTRTCSSLLILLAENWRRFCNGRGTNSRVARSHWTAAYCYNTRFLVIAARTLGPDWARRAMHRSASRRAVRKSQSPTRAAELARATPQAGARRQGAASQRNWPPAFLLKLPAALASRSSPFRT